MNTKESALEQLINEAEAKIRQEAKRWQDMERQEQERKSEKEAELKRFMAEKLGPAYDELRYFLYEEKCDGYWLQNTFHPQDIELNPFSLGTRGETITYQSYISGMREINSAEGLGSLLAENRREFCRLAELNRMLEEVEPS